MMLLAHVRALVIEARDALRESDGEHWPSFTRWACAAVVLTWCFLAIRKNAIPENTDGAAILIGALYGVNRFHAAVAAFANRNQPEK